jgi:GMP synthase (glutamine-hydrolysing)
MEHIAILDFGSQYTHLITRRIREFDVLAKIYPHDISADKLPADVIGLILSGGPQSVYDENAITVDKNIFKLNKPVLGICYGHQLMGQLLGGEVKPGKVREYGRAQLHLKNDSTQQNRLFENIANDSIVWMSHGDSVSKLPAGFNGIAETDDCPITAMADDTHRFYGLQFHPEVDHTEHGVAILKNFVLNICQAEQNWRIEDIVTELEASIRQQVGNKKVFILVSGGVDSSVAFALLTKTLGEDRVRGLYIDTGFMRANESEEIKQGFSDSGMRNFTAVDASEIFFHNLENIYEPEQKRAIIGQTFLDVKDEQIKKLGLNDDDWLLGQGTIYPDVIESGGSQNAQKIKTHHNRVDAIKKMIAEGKIIEPLVDFYKFEVRLIGKKIGLPDNLINRHPFPGPGLAIRCLCQNRDKIDDISAIQKEADELFSQKYPDLFQRVLPIKSVGVQGDNRTYAHPLAVWGEKDWDRLDQLSSYTTNALKNVNRVLLWLNPSSEQTPVFSLAKDNAFLTPKRVDTLREIDDLVHRHIKQAGIYDDIWQFPVVLVPLVDLEGRESIGLRPFNSRDVMTVHFYRMAKEILDSLVAKIQATGKIAHIFYDISNKPPGTTEWE